MSEAEETLAAMRERFGASDSESYLKLQRAVCALINIGTRYLLSEEGTEEEAEAKDSWTRMSRMIASKPLAAQEMMEALVAVVVHIRTGGTAEDWFKEVGIDLLDSIMAVPE